MKVKLKCQMHAITSYIIDRSEAQICLLPSVLRGKHDHIVFHETLVWGDGCSNSVGGGEQAPTLTCSTPAFFY